MSGSNEPSTVGTVTTTSNVRQLSDGNGLNGGPGTSLGISPSDKIGHFGVAPVVQPGTNGGLAVKTANLSILALSVSPVSVAANTTAEQALTVTGILATDVVVTNKPTAQAGLIVATSRVSAANTVQVTFGNVTAAAVTPTASQTWDFITFGANLQTTVALTPASVAANAVSEQYFTVPGVSPGQAVFVNKPTAQAGLAITNVRASGANQVAIQFFNATGAALTPTAAESYVFASASGFSPAPLMMALTQLLTPVSVAANTSAEQTFTVAGLVAGTEVMVAKPSVTTGLVLGGSRVTAANTLGITFANNTAAAITPPAETYTINYFTTEGGSTGTTTILPASKGNLAGSLAVLGITSGT